ncbi:hypothetical protein BGZ68_001082, partial [Mortierella alpina]
RKLPLPLPRPLAGGMENIVATLRTLDAAAKRSLLTQTQNQAQNQAASIPLPLSPSRPASPPSSTPPTPPVPRIQDAHGLKQANATLAAGGYDLEHPVESSGRAHGSDVSQLCSPAREDYLSPARRESPAETMSESWTRNHRQQAGHQRTDNRIYNLCQQVGRQKTDNTTYDHCQQVGLQQTDNTMYDRCQKLGVNRQSGTCLDSLDVNGQIAEKGAYSKLASLPTPTTGWEYRTKSPRPTNDLVEPSWMNQAETFGWDNAAAQGGSQSRGKDDLTLVPQSSSPSSWQKAEDTLSKEYVQADLSKQASALFHYHTRQYLETITLSDPMVDIRLVFTAHHLPRGDDFVSLLGPLRVKHLVDTYVIPHEFTIVDEDSDVVLGLSGTVSRVCDALEGLLQSLASQSGGFALWLLYLLVPCPISHLLVGVHEWELGNDMHRGVVDSLIPSFQKVMGRLHGPISVAQDECIFSLQSCSLSTIMEAVMLVGEICSQEVAAVGGCSHFYRGGHPSVLPKEALPHSSDLLLISTTMDPKVPAGYILRPEMRNCIKDLQKTKHHLQLILPTADAQLLTEEQDLILRNFLDPLGASVRISDPISVQDDVYRVCDVGADGRAPLVLAVMEVVRWMVKKSLTGWSIKVYIPERVVAALRSPGTASSWKSQGIDFDIKPSLAFGGQAHGDSVALEPAEQESVLLVSQSAAVDIENAVRQVVTMIYE